MQARRTLFCLREQEQGRLRIIYSDARAQEPLCFLEQGSGTCRYGDRGTLLTTHSSELQVWVRRGGHRYRAIEAMVQAVLALATFPQLYAYSAADAVVRCSSVESHIRVPPSLWHAYDWPAICHVRMAFSLACHSTSCTQRCLLGLRPPMGRVHDVSARGSAGQRCTCDQKSPYSHFILVSSPLELNH